MRIEVTGSPALHVEQMRAYAEYRVFSQLAAFAHEVRTVRVVLSRSTDNLPTSCVISAELREGDRIRSRSRGTQPTRAIDSAAEKLAEATGKRLQTPARKELDHDGIL
jgi:ribosome-associated translation inhibitor RaiA